jgi:hypothetical protein
MNKNNTKNIKYIYNMADYRICTQQKNRAHIVIARYTISFTITNIIMNRRKDSCFMDNPAQNEQTKNVDVPNYKILNKTQ